MGHPERVANIRGVTKVCNFRQLVISQKLYKVDTVCVEAEQPVKCGLLNGDIADDFEWPQSLYLYVLHLLSYLWNGWGQSRQILHKGIAISLLVCDDKLLTNGHDQGNVKIFLNFWAPII